MLDPQFVCDHLDAVKANVANRNVTADVDKVPALQNEKKRLVREVQAIQQKQNELAKSTGKEKDPEKKKGLIEEGRKLREQVAALEAQQKQIDIDLRAVLLTIPNMS